MDYRTYIDAFPDMDKGIFFYIKEKLPWYREYAERNQETELAMLKTMWMSAQQLDILLYSDYGERAQSALLRNFDKPEGFSEFAKRELASMICAKCFLKWAHMWKAVSADYDPIANYNAEETEFSLSDGYGTESENRTETSENTLNRGETGTQTNDLTDESAHTRNLSDSHGGIDSVSGNSMDKLRALGADSGKERQSASGVNDTTYGHTIAYTGSESESVTRTGTVTNATETEMTASGEQSAERGTERNTSDSVFRKLTRKGNIGVTTSAQMIQGEANLWRNYDFFGEVVKDVANILTLLIYA